jgi:hypothetical protein
MVLFWNPDLRSSDHEFFRKTIRKKDELARFTSLVKNRDFLMNAELVSHLREAGFTGVKKLFEFDYDLHTSLRLKSEFQNKTERLKKWHEYIHEIASLLSPGERKKMLVEVEDHNIHIRFRRSVFKAVKE